MGVPRSSARLSVSPSKVSNEKSGAGFSGGAGVVALGLPRGETEGAAVVGSGFDDRTASSDGEAHAPRISAAPNAATSCDLAIPYIFAQ